MAEFIADNIATVIVGAIVALWLVIAVIKIVRDRKKGGCAGCPYNDSCGMSRGKCDKK